MQFTASTQKNFRHLIVLLLLSALVGAVYANVLQFLHRDIYSPFMATGLGVIRGFLVGILVWPFVLFFRHTALAVKLRRSPFWAEYVFNVLATTIVLVVGIVGSHYLLRPEFTIGVWFPLGFARDTAFGLTVAAVYSLVTRAQRLIGARVFVNVIMGRYHRPVREERIFFFLDLADSTRMAGKLGDLKTHNLISRFFFEVDQSVQKFGGETHRYIGDEVVVTWPVSNSLANARCVECYFHILDRLSQQIADYRSDFGVVPSFRVGIHGGHVVVGECGDQKQEIVYFGDTVNTAARLQEACKEKNVQLIVSGQTMERMTLPDFCFSRSLGEILLRGRDTRLEIFTVDRADGAGWGRSP